MADAAEFSLVSTKTSRMALDLEGSMSFSEFPDDVQLNILSFLRPIEMSAFACTCRRFAALCSPSSPSNDLWLALCERRWGYKTEIRRWSAIPSPRLYKTLDRWEQLIGFWRRIVNGIPRTPPLVFFEWSPSCIIGSRISPSSFAASYAVCKVPFLWLGLSAAGETLSYVHLDNPLSDSDLIPVTIRLVGSNHFVVEETPTFCVHPKMDDSKEVLAVEAGSPPDRVMSEIYQYFTNRTSPGAEKSLRRQRKKKKERLGRKKWEAEHFAKISNYFPTPARPLQGLWKGISKEMSLEFYLVTHDDFGGIACRRVGNSSEPFSGYSLVFWTSNTTFLEPPFSKEEHAIYSMREHIGSVHCNTDRELVSRILCINCSYDQVLPDLAGSSGDPRNVEGRIWEYEDGTFGFGFLRNNFIIDLKHIALDGYILDNLESSHPSHHVL